MEDLLQNNGLQIRWQITSKCLSLISIAAAIFTSVLQNFHPLGPHHVRMHSGRLAYWAINNLLYVLQMLHKWAVFYHYFLTLGPMGWQAKTQICLQPAFSGKRESCPLQRNHIPACIVNFSDVLAFLFLVPSLRPHLATMKNDVMQFFILCLTLMEGTVVHWFQTPKKVKKPETKLLGSSPGKTLNLDHIYSQANKTVNCYSCCCYYASQEHMFCDHGHQCVCVRACGVHWATRWNAY